MPFVIGGKGTGSGGSLSVPNDLRFSGANLAACVVARDAFFAANPSRRVKDVDIILQPTGASIVLQKYDGSIWRDMTAVVKGDRGDTASQLLQSVQGRTGDVVVTKTDLGLQNVDNTSDLSKPISTATQTALNTKAATAHNHTKSDITDLVSDLNTLTTDVSNLNTNKQDKLTSGTTIKTVNGNSLLGSGDVVINAVSDATSTVVGGIKLTGDLGGSAASPSVEKIKGVSINTSGVAAGKVLKASSGSAASFDTLTAADVNAIPTSEKGVASGVAELDANGKLPSARLPAGIVQSVNGLTGAVTLTKTNFGLAQVDNTADVDKPISTAVQTALNGKVNSSLLGANDGVATLDSNGKIPSGQIGSITTGDTYVVANQTARLASAAKKGDVAVQTDTNESYILKTIPATDNANWVKLLFPATVSSVNGATGTVTITKADLSLGNVDNTSDANKPVSTAQQTALNDKVDKTILSAKGSLLTHSGTVLTPHAVGTDGQVLKADSTSPTGLKWEALPAAATIVNNLTSSDTDKPLSAAAGKTLKDLVDTKAIVTTDITPSAAHGIPKIGTSNFAARADHVHPETGIPASSYTAIGQLMAGTGSGTYGQVNLGVDGSFLVVDTTSIHTNLSWKLIGNASNLEDGFMSSIDKNKLDGLSNTVVANALNDTSTTKALSAAQGKVLNDAVALKANAASAQLTGVPVAPTAAVDTNTTQLATTAFVLAQAADTAPSNTASTADKGTSTKYSRADHVHRHPDGLHNGTRKVGTFTGTDYYLESPTAAKSKLVLTDLNFALRMNDKDRYFADKDWTIMRGPSATDALSHKIHMNDTDTVLHSKGGKVRVGVFEGETILRGPKASDDESTFIRLYDSDISLYRHGKFRLGVDAGNTWAHSPDTLWRLWLHNSGFTINRDSTGDMLLLTSSASSVRNSWGTITSDQRLKTPLNTIPDSLLDAWGENVKWGSYNWLEKDPEKADQKIHSGLIAQDIIKAFDAAGVDWTQWKVVEYVEAEDRYGVCYDHCNAIENAYQRRRLDRIEKALGL